jgi:hypothetical protein
MKSLGFTGTRRGMTAAQEANLCQLVHDYAPDIARHGDCIGADAEFHTIVRLMAEGAFIIGHPGMDSRGLSPSRAFCEVDEAMEVLPYLARDKIIVNCVDMMFATPEGFLERTRSGTWATIRMARGVNKPLRIVYPDGTVKSENL